MIMFMSAASLNNSDGNKEVFRVCTVSMGDVCMHQCFTGGCQSTHTYSRIGMLLVGARTRNQRCASVAGSKRHFIGPKI